MWRRGYGHSPNEETRNSEFESKSRLNVEGGFPWCTVQLLSAALSKFASTFLSKEFPGIDFLTTYIPKCHLKHTQGTCFEHTRHLDVYSHLDLLYAPVEPQDFKIMTSRMGRNMLHDEVPDELFLCHWSC